MTRIAAIGETREEALKVARKYGIPDIDAISTVAVQNYGASRGRTYDGYILQPGFLPAPRFWQAFNPSLETRRDG